MKIIDASGVLQLLGGDAYPRTVRRQWVLAQTLPRLETGACAE
jgi:hypothetical protein